MKFGRAPTTLRIRIGILKYVSARRKLLTLQLHAGSLDHDGCDVLRLDPGRDHGPAFRFPGFGTRRHQARWLPRLQTTLKVFRRDRQPMTTRLHYCYIACPALD